MKIRHAEEEKEIKSVLIDTISSQIEYIIWQRDKRDSIRFQVKAFLEEIDETGKMKFCYKNEIPEIQEGEIYFAINNCQAVFKTEYSSSTGSELVVELPKEAKYKERRRHTRKRYKHKEHKQVEVEFTFKDDQEIEFDPIVISQVLDVSESGVCFIVSLETFSHINTGEVFNVKSLCKTLGFKVEKGMIMNARLYKGNSFSQGEFYALGVMFI